MFFPQRELQQKALETLGLDGNPVDFYVYYVYLVGSLSRDLFDTWS